jgi:hypothetical protein
MAAYSANLSGASSYRDANADDVYLRQPSRPKRTRITSAREAVLGDAECYRFKPSFPYRVREFVPDDVGPYPVGFARLCPPCARLNCELHGEAGSWPATNAKSRRAGLPAVATLALA